MGTPTHSDPTREECLEVLAATVPDADEFDRETALYWFAADYHGGQWTNLYSMLSTSRYRPGRMESGPEEDTASADCYAALVAEYFGDA